MKIRYIADMHFDHEEIIAYDNRPFRDVEEMNEVMIARWNRVTEPEDLTWILGDFCAGNCRRWTDILSSLKGKKALIIGNHDNPDSFSSLTETGLLTEIADYREIKDEGRKVILCHYPIFAFRDHYFGAVHLYGHVHVSYEWNLTEHTKRLLRNLYVRDDILTMTNVGAMLPYMDYTPRSLDEILSCQSR